MGQKKISERVVPCSGCLLETVNCLLQFAHMLWELRMEKAWWLAHVDFLRKVPMQECVIDIHLAKWSVVGECYSEKNFNCLWLDDWTEGLGEVNSWMLMISFGDKVDFVV